MRRYPVFCIGFDTLDALRQRVYPPSRELLLGKSRRHVLYLS